MEIRIGRSTDEAKVLAFIAEMQADPVSMIPYLSINQGQIRQELGELAPPWTDTLRLAFQDDRLIGVALVEMDLARGRVWIYGPWVLDEHWEPVADILVQRLLDEVIPAGINDVELSGRPEHVRLSRLAEHRGWARSNVFAVLGLDRAQAIEWEPRTLDRLSNANAEAVARLHDELFPTAPWNGSQLLEKAGSGVVVLVAANGGRVSGYVAAELRPGPQGYIHFVGVDPPYRRRGTGRELVIKAVCRLLAAPDVSEVFLSVDTSNGGALALYRSLGFITKLEIVGFRTPVAGRPQT